MNFFAKFPTRHQAAFMQRLSLYLRTGIPITRGIAYIRKDSSNKAVARILQSLEDAVGAGIPLSQALEKFPKQFSPFTIGFIRAGEASGNLSQTLASLSTALTKQESLRRKLLGTLAYPAIILCGTLGITIFLVLFIFPKILPVLEGLHTRLPITTRILIRLQVLLAHDWLFLIVAFIVTFISVTFLSRFRQVKRLIEYAYLHIPVVSYAYQTYFVSLFTRALGAQLRGGIRILSALELSSSSLSSILYREAVQTISDEILRGRPLSGALRMYPRLFPPLVCQMVDAGEMTGSLSENLELLARTYEENLDEFSRNLTTLIEPALMIVMGFVVGFVALAIITPIYGVTQNLTAV